jgi:hypothetical protein
VTGSGGDSPMARNGRNKDDGWSAVGRSLEDKKAAAGRARRLLDTGVVCVRSSGPLTEGDVHAVEEFVEFLRSRGPRRG